MSRFALLPIHYKFPCSIIEQRGAVLPSTSYYITGGGTDLRHAVSMGAVWLLPFDLSECMLCAHLTFIN